MIGLKETCRWYTDNKQAAAGMAHRYDHEASHRTDRKCIVSELRVPPAICVGTLRSCGTTLSRGRCKKEHMVYICY